MREISYYINAVRSSILRHTICPREIDEIWHMEMLEAGRELNRKTIYIVEESDYATLHLLRSIRHPAAVFVSCPDGHIPDIPVSQNIYACFVNMSALALYSKLDELIRAKEASARMKDIAIISGGNLRICLDMIAKQFNINAFVLNEGYQLLASSPTLPQRCRMTEMLMREKYVSAAAQERYFSKEHAEDDYSVVAEGKLFYYAFRHKSTPQTFLLVFVADRRLFYALRLLNDKMSAMFAAGELLLNDLVSGAQDLTDQYLVGRMLDGTIREESMIREFFGSPENASYTIIVVSGKNMKPQLHCIEEKMKECFHEVPVTWYHGDLVGLLLVPTEENKELIPEADYRRWMYRSEKAEKSFEKLLEEKDITGAIATPSRTFANISYVYKSLMQVLPIARNIDKNRRLYYTGSYNIYRIIDYGFKYFQQNEIAENYGILMHPDIANIIKHDVNEDDNLSDILMNYLVLGGDIQRISEALFMHRNTVYKKLKKIESMLKIEITDPNFILYASVSLLIHQYGRDVLQLDHKKTFNPRKRDRR